MNAIEDKIENLKNIIKETATVLPSQGLLCTSF